MADDPKPDFTDDDIDQAMQMFLVPMLNTMGRILGGHPPVLPLAFVAMGINLAAQWCDGETTYDEGLQELQKCFDNYSKYCRDFAKKTPEEKELVRAATEHGFDLVTDTAKAN